MLSLSLPMNEQAELFATLPSATARQRSLSERFMEWIESPHGRAVYSEFVRFAREVRISGRKQYGAKAIWERLRWHFQIERRAGEEYSLNNSYVSRLARVAAYREPDLKHFFEFRRLKSGGQHAQRSRFSGVTDSTETPPRDGRPGPVSDRPGASPNPPVDRDHKTGLADRKGRSPSSREPARFAEQAL